jgi:hypothetical protein
VSEQGERLEHHAGWPAIGRYIRDVGAAQAHRSARRHLETRKHANQRRFTAARGTDYREKLSRTNIE